MWTLQHDRDDHELILVKIAGKSDCRRAERIRDFIAEELNALPWKIGYRIW